MTDLKLSVDLCSIITQFRPEHADRNSNIQIFEASAENPLLFVSLNVAILIESKSCSAAYGEAGNPDFLRTAMFNAESVKWVSIGGSGSDDMTTWILTNKSDTLGVPTNKAVRGLH